MPATPHWPLLTLLAAATVGLMRRRASAADAPAADPVSRPSVDAVLSAAATDAAVYGWAYNGCTDREIADRFQLAEAELRQRFAAVLAVARALRAYAIRKGQTDAATAKANVPMLTWLGRNELGQSHSPTAHGEPEPEVE